MSINDLLIAHPGLFSMPADLLCHYGQGSIYALANISVDDTETTVMQTCLHVLSLLPAAA